MVMPAFGAYAGGLNVRDRAFTNVFPTLAFTAHMLGERRVYAVAAKALPAGLIVPPVRLAMIGSAGPGSGVIAMRAPSIVIAAGLSIAAMLSSGGVVAAEIKLMCPAPMRTTIVELVRSSSARHRTR